MCILLLSLSSHPKYPFILLSNRDEFLHRPTKPASFWSPPHTHILGGRDLHRPEQGTWLGITRDGRIAAITNVREESSPSPSTEEPVVASSGSSDQQSAQPKQDAKPQASISGTRSRGAIANAWLQHVVPPTSTSEKGVVLDEFLSELSSDESIMKEVGGFSLLCGQLKKKEGGISVAVFSNRSPTPGDGDGKAGYIKEKVYGLSNSSTAEVWSKVQEGKKLLEKVIRDDLATREEEGAGGGGERDEGERQEKFIEKLFDVLSVDNLPPKKPEESLEGYMQRFRESIFIRKLAVPVELSMVNMNTNSQLQQMRTPVMGRGGDEEEHGVKVDEEEQRRVLDEHKTSDTPPMVYYGTQKQTVILVDGRGYVTFVERTLYDHIGESMEIGKGDRRFEFFIRGCD